MSEMRPIDLRSDTVTRPCPAMRRAMAAAEVGDDVYGEDPTVRALEERAAEAVGTESALLVPTGTMGNQVAIHLLARPGTEAIVEAGSHVYNYELGAMAAWSGVLPRVLQGDRGAPDSGAVALAASVGPYYRTRATLLVIENTHNHSGGRVIAKETLDRLLETARRAALSTHLDGARIFNAATALGLPAADLASGFDTVMFCLSKGLGAPIGSLLCASHALIREARIVRKRMGGGMRQAGVIAAAGLVALERNVPRLAEDHARARRLAEAVAGNPRFRIDPADVESNIVIAELEEAGQTDEVLERLLRAGVLAGSMGAGRIRFVTHLDVDDDGIARACDAVGRI